MLGLEVNMNSSDEEFLNAELDAVEADQVNQVWNNFGLGWHSQQRLFVMLKKGIDPLTSLPW